MRRLLLVMLAIGVVLSGCGGGGSNGGVGAAAPVTFSPATLTSTGIQSVSQSVQFTATLNTSVVNGNVYIAVIDDVGVIQTDWTFTMTSATSASIQFKTLPMLPVGTYTGSLKVYLCKDIYCTDQYPGSPVQLPYNIVVTQPPPVGFISPASINESMEIGALNPVSITLTHGSLVNGIAYYRVTDPNSVFAATPMPSYNWYSGTVQLSVSTALSTGTYSGTLQLSLCKDQACISAYPGSPLALPYSITITPATNITPLQALTGVGSWETHQGNASHNAYLPVTLDPSQFTKRWAWKPAGNASTRLGYSAIANGILYFVNDGDSNAKTLLALQEYDASLAWQKNFGSFFSLSAPATANNKVYVTTGGQGDTFMWGLNAADGAVGFQTAFGSQWPSYPAPTVYSGTVYTAGGSYGGMNAFDATSGASAFQISLAQEDRWTPAVDANNAYTFIGGQFQVINRLTGEVTQSFMTTDSVGATSSPVIGGANAILAARKYGYSLYSFNPSTSMLNWEATGSSFVSDPVVANGVVYITRQSPNNGLEARSLATGELLWSWSTPNNESIGLDNIIVTNNLVLVSTPFRTYAIDINSKVSIWLYNLGGKLAISANGILYIVNGSTQGQITAINLR